MGEKSHQLLSGSCISLPQSYQNGMFWPSLLAHFLILPGNSTQVGLGDAISTMGLVYEVGSSQ